MKTKAEYKWLEMSYRKFTSNKNLFDRLREERADFGDILNVHLAYKTFEEDDYSEESRP